MDKETEQYYRNFFDLFRTEGWKQLQKEIKESIANINNVVFTEGNDDLWHRKGQLQVLNNLANLEDTLKTAFEDIP